MKVRLPGHQDDANDVLEPMSALTVEDESYVDVVMDNDLKTAVEEEFNAIWNSLVADINSPLKKLRSGGQMMAQGLGGSGGVGSMPAYQMPPVGASGTIVSGGPQASRP